MMNIKHNNNSSKKYNSLNKIQGWFSNHRVAICFMAIGMVYFFNLFIDIMDTDASEMAAISQQMFNNMDFLHTYKRGFDYLDKPPMLFWLASLSFSVFGYSNFAYKLPALLIIILGIYSTYRFSLLYYDKRRSILAALIFATSQAIFLVTNDVRTDGILTGMIIFSVWQLCSFIKNANMSHLVWGAVGVAAAMMTKGPIGAVIPAFAIGGDLLLKRDWKGILKPHWILFFIIVIVLLLPMCYGLYTQFDMHPEKIVYGLQSPSGIKFFFWTQSFGRITGDIYWNNGAGFFYFFHTILWDFQPWVIFFIFALGSKISKLISNSFKADIGLEYISFFGFLLSFLALSRSNYKLPHYIFPLLSFASVITADFIIGLKYIKPKVLKWISGLNFGFMHLFFMVLNLGFFLIFPAHIFLIFFVIVGFLLFWMVYIKANDQVDKIIYSTLVAIIVFNFCLSVYFYPNLMSYQSSSEAGRYALKYHIPKGQLLSYCISAGSSADFYANNIVLPIDLNKWNTYEKGSLIYTDEIGMQEMMEEKKLNCKILQKYNDYYVSSLNWDFLNKYTRADEIKKRYLMVKL